MGINLSHKEPIRIMFTDFWRPATEEYIKRYALYKLLSKHFNLILSDQPDFLIYSCFGHDYLKYNCLRIFYTGENVRPNFNECDYAFSFDYPITERNYRLPLYRLYPEYLDIIKPKKNDIANQNDRKFCCFLVSRNKSDKRSEFFHLLSEYKNVDSGGKLFNNIGYQIPIGQEVKWMGNYKFCISFENASYPGYTTEKLVRALAANTIPIYWGNPLVENDLNTRSFINCNDFENFRDVIEYVKQVDNNPSIHQEILDQPYLPDQVERDFCKEENIIQKFYQIFSERKVFISKFVKQTQKLKYPGLKLKQKWNKRIKPKLKKIIFRHD